MCRESHYPGMQVSEIMTRAVEAIAPDASLQAAAEAMEAMGVGSLPVCDGRRLVGTITDRDIVVKVLAQGKDPASWNVGDLAEGKPVTIGADDEASEILHTMGANQVRRLPVIDGHDLVGIVSLSDVAKVLPDKPVGELLEAISA